VGTPRRLLVTIATMVILAGFTHFNPGVIHSAVVSLINELWPLIEIIIVGAIMVLGYRIIWRGLSKSSGGKKSSN